MSAWASKGKGKGKGKGDSPGGQGHTLPRTRLSADKFTGTVVEWKGKYGWIKPAEEIEHEKASLRGGRLFVGMDDIIGRQDLDGGAPCEFHICEDDSGLGAEEVVQTGDGSPEEAAKLGAKGVKGAKGAKGKGGKGKAPAWGGAWGGAWAAPAWGGAWAAPAKGWWAPPAAKGAWSGFDKGGKDKGKGKGKRKEGGKGHLLPKTRISADKFTGTVSAWKGKYGFIQPAEAIEHEKASLHKGGLFVGINDLEGGITELTVGATVEFHICEDDSGLGAEEVVQH